VVLLCGPRGRAAAELLPGVDELVECALPWIDAEPGPVDRAGIDALVARLAATGADEAVVFTSFHQSPLPLALILRMAGVGRVAAISDDYPGSLLDVRHRVPAGIPEAERALSLAAAAGFALPPGDDQRLRLRPVAAAGDTRGGTRPAGELPDEPGYVVVHPGSSVAARACPPQLCAGIVAALRADGHRVVVTGGPAETALTGQVAVAGAVDLGGRTSLAGLADVISRAGCLVVGNTGPAHLAAALGVPVVSLFAPTVPFGQWAPYRVPVVRLGDPTADCRNTRVTRCPLPGHPCLSGVDPADVVAAVRLLSRPAPPPDRAGTHRPVPALAGGGSGR
ncbi:glycosyltransferase family 9 protein, partial [Micromonospora echinofusca]